MSTYVSPYLIKNYQDVVFLTINLVKLIRNVEKQIVSSVATKNGRKRWKRFNAILNKAFYIEWYSYPTDKDGKRVLSGPREIESEHGFWQRIYGDYNIEGALKMFNDYYGKISQVMAVVVVMEYSLYFLNLAKDILEENSQDWDFGVEMLNIGLGNLEKTDLFAQLKCWKSFDDRMISKKLDIFRVNMSLCS